MAPHFARRWGRINRHGSELPGSMKLMGSGIITLAPEVCLIEEFRARLFMRDMMSLNVTVEVVHGSVTVRRIAVFAFPAFIPASLEMQRFARPMLHKDPRKTSNLTTFWASAG